MGILEELRTKRLRASQLAIKFGTTSRRVVQQCRILKAENSVHLEPGSREQDAGFWVRNDAVASPSHFEPAGGS
jgi:hypothetical protein